MLLQEFGQATDRYVESTGALYGTHRTDMNALAIIIKYQQRGELPSPRDLSRELHLSSPATTAMMDRLERWGYIERRRTDKDRRVVRIAMTDKARADGRKMFMPLSSTLTSIIANYNTDEIALISDFMRKIVDGTDASREEAVSQHDADHAPIIGHD